MDEMLLHILIPVFVVRFDHGRASLNSCGASGIARNTEFYATSRAGCHGQLIAAETLKAIQMNRVGLEGVSNF